MKIVHASSEFEQGVLVVPREIPKSTAPVRDEKTGFESNSSTAVGAVGSIPYTFGDKILANIFSETPRPIPRPGAQKVRVSSGVAQGLLIHQVKPQYPMLALQARIQGSVILQATIDKDGTVQDLRVISGHPLLTPAAIEAVKQWRYRPYYLNNEPVAVDTQINVNFTLGSQ
jgi:protein TonB